MSIDPNSLQNDHLWRFGDRAHFPSMGSQLPKHIPGVFGRKSQEFGGFWDVFFLGGNLWSRNFMPYNHNQSLFDRYWPISWCFFEATHTFFWGQLLTIVTRSSLWRWCQLLTAFRKTIFCGYTKTPKKKGSHKIFPWFSMFFPWIFHGVFHDFPGLAKQVMLWSASRWECFGHRIGCVFEHRMWQ